MTTLGGRADPGREAAPTGLNAPIASVPERQPGSTRRTTSIDTRTTPDGGLSLDGAARDFHTGSDGLGSVRDAAHVSARLGADHTLVSIDSSAAPDIAGPLIGQLVGRGFRAAVHERLPAAAVRGTLLGLLLDDLPVAALLSGYALLYSGTLGERAGRAGALQADICSGWRADGTMMVTLRAEGAIPIPTGPVANDLGADDPEAWHDLPPLPSGSMRRQRLVDVSPGSPRPVRAMFRDTHTDDAGRTTILHEYSVTAGFDAETDQLVEVEAVPQVLPWDECPAAAASARRLSGRSPREVRDLVPAEFRGTSTCTHLNDLLRSLADVPALLADD